MKERSIVILPSKTQCILAGGISGFVDSCIFLILLFLIGNQTIMNASILSISMIVLFDVFLGVLLGAFFPAVHKYIPGADFRIRGIIWFFSVKMILVIFSLLKPNSSVTFIIFIILFICSAINGYLFSWIANQLVRMSVSRRG